MDRVIDALDVAPCPPRSCAVVLQPGLSWSAAPGSTPDAMMRTVEDAQDRVDALRETISSGCWCSSPKIACFLPRMTSSRDLLELLHRARTNSRPMSAPWRPSLASVRWAAVGDAPAGFGDGLPRPPGPTKMPFPGPLRPPSTGLRRIELTLRRWQRAWGSSAGRSWCCSFGSVGSFGLWALRLSEAARWV